MSEMSGMESGAQENTGGMPAGPEPYNPSGQTMPTDGGPGSSPTPAPGEVAAPGADEFTMEPNVAAAADWQVGQIDRFTGDTQVSSSGFSPMPTPDN